MNIFGKYLRISPIFLLACRKIQCKPYALPVLHEVQTLSACLTSNQVTCLLLLIVKGYRIFDSEVLQKGKTFYELSISALLSPFFVTLSNRQQECRGKLICGT